MEALIMSNKDYVDKINILLDKVVFDLRSGRDCNDLAQIAIRDTIKLGFTQMIINELSNSSEDTLLNSKLSDIYNKLNHIVNKINELGTQDTKLPKRDPLLL